MIKEKTIKGMKKPELIDLLDKTINQMNEIGEFYEIAISSDENNTYKEEIEEFYQYLTSTSETEQSKIDEVKVNVDKIIKYYQELFTDTDGAEAIVNKISAFRETLGQFYDEYFSEDDGESTKSQKIDHFYSSIKKFYDELKKEGGIERELGKIYSNLKSDYQYFYGEDEKINTLKDSEQKIKLFFSELNNKIKPEIETANKEINSLLSIGTGKSIVKGYLLSKAEYRNQPKYRKGGKKIKFFCDQIVNIFIWLEKVITISFDYVIFIFPLLLALIIFTKPEIINIIFKNAGVNSNFLSELGFGSRIVISLPLWWISWFGQRNIMHKKRIAEEYNHKAQVSNMYLHFVSKDVSSHYPLSKESMKKLEEGLMDVIFRNPAEVYKSDMTFADKLIRLMPLRKIASDNNVSVFPPGVENKNKSKQ